MAVVSADARLRRRYAFEACFKYAGLAAVLFAATVLLVLVASVAVRGYSAFWHTEIQLEIYFDPQIIDPSGTGRPDTLSRGDYAAVIKTALKARFPNVQDRREQRMLYQLISSGSPYHLRDMVVDNPGLIDSRRQVWLLASDEVDQFHKGHIPCGATLAERSQHGTPCAIPEPERRVKDMQVRWLDSLAIGGQLRSSFNTILFTAGDSREPELAGLRNSLIGSFLTLLVTLALAGPIGVATAVYLEEFAPRSWLTQLMEISVNNLTAVPSIVFGLLGLAIFLNLFGMPRAAPLVGGMILGLMTLPTIIIAVRSALRAIPDTLREAALALGASRHQMVFDHTLPYALPGALTGTIIGMAQALGETAPLLMIGMVAFIADAPAGVNSPATVLPVQIYLWADSPERAFTERTAAATLILMLFLLIMNAGAILWRSKIERQTGL